MSRGSHRAMSYSRIAFWSRSIGDEYEVAGPDPARSQRRSDRLRLREVEHQAGHPTLEGRHGDVHRLLRLAAEDHLATRLEVVLRDLEPDRAGPADDDDGSLVTAFAAPSAPGAGRLGGGRLAGGQASTPRSARAAQDGSQR